MLSRKNVARTLAHFFRDIPGDRSGFTDEHPTRFSATQANIMKLQIHFVSSSFACKRESAKNVFETSIPRASCDVARERHSVCKRQLNSGATLMQTLAGLCSLKRERAIGRMREENTCKKYSRTCMYTSGTRHLFIFSLGKRLQVNFGSSNRMKKSHRIIPMTPVPALAAGEAPFADKKKRVHLQPNNLFLFN